MSRWLIALGTGVVAAVLALGGCGGGGGGGGSEPVSEPQPQPAIGPIPAAEFATVPPPTFNQVITAFRTVTAANPALSSDEPALSRALFDEVRRTSTSITTGAGAERARILAATMRQALFDLNSRLTLEEWKLVIRSPINSARVASTIELSARAAMDSLPCDADVNFIDGKADALRHAYWNALMTRRTSAAFAELFATAHETGSANSAAASAMDLHNNALGRALAERLPAASDDQWLELLLEQSFTFVAAGAALPAAGLVHIAERARRPFDGRFAGTLMQPDSGAEPWAVEFNLSRCGTAVRGNYRATRGAVAVERRFSGTLDSMSSMSLAIANPYAFEATAGPSPCLGMRATLSGSEQALSGPWTSTSCPQGGVISVAR